MLYKNCTQKTVRFTCDELKRFELIYENLIDLIEKHDASFECQLKNARAEGYYINWRPQLHGSRKYGAVRLLEAALYEHNDQAAVILIHSGASVNVKPHNYKTLLYLAAKTNTSLDIFSEILKRTHISKITRKFNGTTVIRIFCVNYLDPNIGDQALPYIKLLLDYKADPNINIFWKDETQPWPYPYTLVSHSERIKRSGRLEGYITSYLAQKEEMSAHTSAMYEFAL